MVFLNFKCSDGYNSKGDYMNFTEVLFLSAPFIPVFMFLLGILDLKTMLITCISFLSCFITLLWGNSFVAVCVGAAVFSFIQLLLTLKSTVGKKQNIEKYGIVSSVDNDGINVLYNGTSYTAVCVGNKVTCGDVVRIEWERNGVLFVVKN